MVRELPGREAGAKGGLTRACTLPVQLHPTRTRQKTGARCADVKEASASGRPWNPCEFALLVVATS
jgi:hypothetical protein